MIKRSSFGYYTYTGASSEPHPLVASILFLALCGALLLVPLSLLFSIGHGYMDQTNSAPGGSEHSGEVRLD